MESKVGCPSPAAGGGVKLTGSGSTTAGEEDFGERGFLGEEDDDDGGVMALMDTLSFVLSLLVGERLGDELIFLIDGERTEKDTCGRGGDVKDSQRG